jgi:tetratricopeptide (TPR) repeat protein
MKRALIIGLVLVLCRAAFAAPNEDEASGLLDALAAARTAGERTAAVESLLALSPMPVDFLTKFLARERKTSTAARRSELAAINAAIPNKKGKFSTPRRQTQEQKDKADEFDWLAELVKREHSEALGEAMADVAAIRALAASETTAAGTTILEFGFSEEGLSYRDECGRYLRKMSPWSLPALIVGSESRQSDVDRYATYQLEVLDRQDPNKAIKYTANEDLKIEIIKTMAESQYRTGVYPILKLLDDVSPRLRRAAREAWLEYAVGKEPRPSPRRRIQEPGGKMSKNRVPLWFNHRELADIEIRRVLEEINGKAPPEASTLKGMTEELFGYYDDRRNKQLDDMVSDALGKASAGSLLEGAELLDRVLAQNPDHPRRKEMAKVFFDYAKSLEKEQKWREASMAFAKAHAMSPEGERARQALAQHHYARGKAVEAEGGNASAEFARARDVDAGVGGAGGGRRWMLYAGMGGGAAGLLLFAIGLAIRRR